MNLFQQMMFVKKSLNQVINLLKQLYYTIVSFKMVEKPKGTKGSDYMQFTFSNMKRNIAIDDSVFKVQ